MSSANETASDATSVHMMRKLFTYEASDVHIARRTYALAPFAPAHAFAHCHAMVLMLNKLSWIASGIAQ